MDMYLVVSPHAEKVTLILKKVFFLPFLSPVATDSGLLKGLGLEM